MVIPEKAGEVTYIDIEELVIDPCNIRGGAWDYDEELIKSVKQRGVDLPLIVRPLKVEGKMKYGVVAGGRRFNAAIAAGLKSVPCKVFDMSDVEAMGLSLEENYLRRDLPTWKYIEWMGKMYDRMRKDFTFKGGMKERFAELERRTALKKEKIKDYVRICLYLPEEIKALLRPREDRTTNQEERLKKFLYRTESPPKNLTVSKALLILNELEDFPLEKQVEVAAHIIYRNYETASKVVKAVKENPKASMWEIDKIIRGKMPDRYSRTVSFDKETLTAIENACLHRQRKLPELLEDIVKDWLRRNFYLAREEPLATYLKEPSKEKKGE
jgi:ParB/RepB/Spo0J family partition protein